ncbi:hypothetical protein [Solibacillus isronensis]|uniref:hypothetical protein n=1 Tax=Solibacillus isronensis TaxID=412383 RepID=UPI00203D65C2|nr:hypothetical protein [Solibacillus isronensis]MCM3721508.1 hypothetical protein [Solibacillus isronensis]
MLVEVDGYDQQVLLSGPSYTLEQLNRFYRQAKKQATSSIEITHFCVHIINLAEFRMMQRFRWDL